jgi:hypothetical protein
VVHMKRKEGIEPGEVGRTGGPPVSMFSRKTMKRCQLGCSGISARLHGIWLRRVQFASSPEIDPNGLDWTGAES